MTAFRCSRCSTNWPHHKDFARCPECNDATSPLSEAKPIDADEAKSRRNHALFEAFCEERDKRLLEEHERELAALPTQERAA